MTGDKCTQCNGRGYIWWAGFAPIPKEDLHRKGLFGISMEWVQVKRPCNHCQPGEPSEQKPIARSISYQVKKDTDDES